MPAATFTATCNLEVRPHGLALSADGSTFFAVGCLGEDTALATVSSGCSAPPASPSTPPTQPPSQSSGAGAGQPPPNAPLPPRRQFSPRKARPGRPDLYLELEAFRATLVSRLTRIPLGYRYFFAAQHIRCINGATNLIFTVAGARRSTPCRSGPVLISGQLAPHKTYEIHVQAVRMHRHKVIKRGASYSGRLYMPGNEVHWTPVAQLPPAI